MTVINHTPFPAIAFRQLNLMGEMNGVVSVRGTFKLAQNGPLTIAEQQLPLVMSDTYAGDPHKTGQTEQTDLVPFKPGTDITVRGSAFAPDAKPSPAWLCGVKVGPVRKILQVTGPRFWEPVYRGAKLSGWKMTPATPVSEVPLDWGLAWGGPLPGPADQPQDVCRSNPLGCGIVDLDHSDPRLPVLAPQIEDPKDPIRDWNRSYVPQGFGPISPWWHQRQQYAGSYDEQWKLVRHPLLPKDFDYRFYQAASPDLIATPWLNGDEPIELVHLTQTVARVVTRLPGIKLRMRLLRDEGYGYADLVLDGVHIVLRRDFAGVFLTWRAGFPWPDGKGMPELAVVQPQTAESI